MKKKEIVNFIVSIVLILLASIVMILPILGISDLLVVLLVIYGFYCLVKLTQFLLVYKDKDYEALAVSLISLGAFIAEMLIPFETVWVVLVFMIWMGLMCLIKLKKADVYHDHKNYMWVLQIFNLFVFLTSGLLTSINLHYDSDVQILIIGFFFFVSGLLDGINPIVLYIEAKNEDSK